MEALFASCRDDYPNAVDLFNRRVPAECFSTLRADSTYNAGGNMETLPPHEHNGVRFPAGRVIVGGDQNQPQSLAFFRAQELQSPLVLDSAWLFVKHVDEMLQAIPARTPRGWAVVAIDPQLGLGLLRRAAQYGLGSAPVMSGNKAPSGPTIDQFLQTPSNIQAAEISAGRMAANLALLQRETGLTDAEIFKVPALIAFKDTVQDYLAPRRSRSLGTRDEAEEAALDAEFLQFVDAHGQGGDSRNETAAAALRRRQDHGSGPVTLESLLPSLVNGVPLSDAHYLAPKPYGPIFNGHDVFETVAVNQYKKAGFTTVEFLDEWRLHQSSGDLHCFTNTFRDASEPWWSK
ncbi:putative protein-arginine deiminase [Cordyceps militaris CM01]|uniref:Protein-arginine deiminase C-terminal domain-containing protein n=1 Tax=Cordyceps militaris (strain CM01) TaxID=983644 RepID=G3JRN9_CORMM|nr:putative protein-arginine deiminase [Cordyceps militaris CM01]EGX88429.1 putative protein-arginine deiminase [Cordyceps militaris CM01]